MNGEDSLIQPVCIINLNMTSGDSLGTTCLVLLALIRLVETASVQPVQYYYGAFVSCCVDHVHDL